MRKYVKNGHFVVFGAAERSQSEWEETIDVFEQ